MHYRFLEGYYTHDPKTETNLKGCGLKPKLVLTAVGQVDQ